MKKMADSEQFISKSYSSSEEFAEEYSVFKASSRTKEVFLLILEQLVSSISHGNIDHFKKFTTFLNSIITLEELKYLQSYYNDSNSAIKTTNLVILGCKHNQDNILECILSNDSSILRNISWISSNRDVNLSDQDETQHSALYYAIRSGNIAILDILINKAFFRTTDEKLEEILSQTYEELKVKNISLSNDAMIFVENKLIDLRFFSCNSTNNKKVNIVSIGERINFVLENVEILKTFNSNVVDECFLYLIRFIVQNIHTLKRELKCTYVSLPWEEIEFVLVTFVILKIKNQKLNIYNYNILNKKNVLNHLYNFAKQLKIETDLLNLKNKKGISILPKTNRNEIIIKIIKNNPEFQELYNDYDQIRDIYSLKKINKYILLALSVDGNERQGQLAITRALQVIGEFLKNTLESPKLSESTCQLLQLSLSRHTRQIILDIRNSLSHPDSLSNRIKVERSTTFFTGLQNDLKKIKNILTIIIDKNNNKNVNKFLNKLSICENQDEIKMMVKILQNDRLVNPIGGKKPHKILEQDKLEELVKRLREAIVDTTVYEEELFIEMEKKISSLEETGGLTENKLFEFKKIKITKGKPIAQKKLRRALYCNNRGPRATDNYFCPIKPHLQEISRIAINIFNSVNQRTENNKKFEVNSLICEILTIAEFEIENTVRVEEFNEKLKKRNYFSYSKKQKQKKTLTKEECYELFTLRQKELRNVLELHDVNSPNIEKMTCSCRKLKLKLATEMLLLDMLSILEGSNLLEHNNVFLDDTSPLLTGKCLRNHLAHDNAVTKTLLSNPSLTVMLNAKKISSEDVIRKNKKIGNIKQIDFSMLKTQHNQNLYFISNQKNMFDALEAGDMKELKKYIELGADIHGKSLQSSWSTLHFAARSSNLEVVKFIYGETLEANVKDYKGRTPLHIAAAYGRTEIVQFLIKEAGLDVNELDNQNKTALHIAAKHGHANTLKVLLDNKADIYKRNSRGRRPLHCAIIEDSYIEVVKLLIDRDVNTNDVFGGFTPLHVAAERGCLELVKLFLQYKPDIDAKTDGYYTPLHAACHNGRQEIVGLLLENGANVNAETINGFTPLLYAVENGHLHLIEILLQNKANINIVDSTYQTSTLHLAALFGFSQIASILLKNGANAKASTYANQTALHLAAENNNIDVARMLVEYNVDINARDTNNVTPVISAVMCGHIEMVDFLITKGADIHCQCKFNMTPLHRSALGGWKDITSLLIKNGADVNSQDITGDTPLHVSAILGQQDIVEQLLAGNANINASNIHGQTPLYVAAAAGQIQAVTCLLKNHANVNAESIYVSMPLHAASLQGYKDVVNVLIQNKAKINEKDSSGMSPLHWAVESDSKDVINILIANNAVVNSRNTRGETPLFSAVKCNNKEIVQILLLSGADVNAVNGVAITRALFYGSVAIFKLILKSKAEVNMKLENNLTLLHAAASKGEKEKVEVLIEAGAVVDAEGGPNNETPLHSAVRANKEKSLKVLIKHGSNINTRSADGMTVLHIASGKGYYKIVKMLLHNNVLINVKDDKNRTALELAVANGHFGVMQMLLSNNPTDINSPGEMGYTLLHLACQNGNLDIVKYLLEKGADINARNYKHSKPIHIAAREGCKEVVTFLLNNRCSIHDLGINCKNLLHYAVLKDNLEMIKYLVEQDLDVNSRSLDGSSVLHTAAAECENINIIIFLLQRGAVYNSKNIFGKQPVDKATNKDIVNLFKTTQSLFEAVKNHNIEQVETDIQNGGCVDAINSSLVSVLHIAVWKGYDEIVKILLHSKANPNVIGKNGYTPLHYAAKFSHLSIVKILLSYGAIYNISSASCKIPFDFAVDEHIQRLLTLVDNCFENVKQDNHQIIKQINQISEFDILKSVLNARDKNNKTLIVAATERAYSKLEELKDVFQSFTKEKIILANILVDNNQCQLALDILEDILKIRQEIFGVNSPSTLDIQLHVAQTLYRKGEYSKAYSLTEDIFEKQKATLGADHKDTLSTGSFKALIMHRQGKDHEAYNIYKEVCQQQIQILGSNHEDVLNTQLNMTLVLNSLCQYEEALNINKKLYDKFVNKGGELDKDAIIVQNNIAMTLSSQHKYEEALELFEKVYEKKKVSFGNLHANTLRTLYNMAVTLTDQKKYTKALEMFEDVFNVQSTVLGPDHPDTLLTQNEIGKLYFAQKKLVQALKIFRKCFDKSVTVFGLAHKAVISMKIMLQVIDDVFKSEGESLDVVIQQLQAEINTAASSGDVTTIQRLCDGGVDVNDTDCDGRTPLHFAVANGQADVVTMLLQQGANVCVATKKGNTPLHTSAMKGDTHITEMLLQSVRHGQLSGFINAKTYSLGMAAAHIAASNGCIKTLQLLFKFGAVFNIKNNNSLTPLDITNDKQVIAWLRLTEELFVKVETGDGKIIEKLSTFDPDELSALLNCRNSSGKTALQVAIKHGNIASPLLKIIQSNNI